MSQSQQHDALEFKDLNWPYNRILVPTNDVPRLYRGLNMMITQGGALAKRLGTLEITNTEFNNRPDRIVLYETEENPPKVYFLASMQTATSTWKLFYFRPGTSTAWTEVGNIRGLNGSSVPHEIAIFKGKAYIRSVPTTGDKFGSAIFDGSDLSVAPWGLDPPDEPAHISGALTFLDGEINATVTTINVVDGSVFPATPFVAQIEFERVNVTNVATNVLTVTRGIEGTIADTHPDNTVIIFRDWSASDHRVDVIQRWTYTYAYVSPTGHISARAPVETNPDKMPSATGPFIDLIPKLDVTGNSDTTNIPFINIYRKKDGGGDFYFLEQITNTGAATIEYLDDSLESGAGGGTFNDPIPDGDLDQADIGPELTSNLPPPPFEEGTLGTTDPEPGTPIVEFAGRLWYAIGSRLFYSGNEEIDSGRPQECYPDLNFFDFQFPVQNLAATSDALYIFTLQRIYRLTGTNLETFNPRPILDSTGMPYGHPRAIVQYDQYVAFLTHDYRIARIGPNGEMQVLSDPLLTDIVDEINTDAEIDIIHWADLEKDWIIVNGHRTDDTFRSKQWILDLKKTDQFRQPFWYVPWRIRSVAQFSGRIAENTNQRRAVFAIWDPTASVGRLARLDPTFRTGTDLEPDGGTEKMSYNGETSLFTVPPGNHLNALRKPMHIPTVHDVRIERLAFAGDENPDLYYYADDYYTDPINVEVLKDPTRKSQGKGFTTIYAPINKTMYRFALKIQGVNTTHLAEYHSIAFGWNPEAGTGGS